MGKMDNYKAIFNSTEGKQFISILNNVYKIPSYEYEQYVQRLINYNYDTIQNTIQMYKPALLYRLFNSKIINNICLQDIHHIFYNTSMNDEFLKYIQPTLLYPPFYGVIGKEYYNMQQLFLTVDALFGKELAKCFYRCFYKIFYGYIHILLIYQYIQKLLTTK